MPLGQRDDLVLDIRMPEAQAMNKKPKAAPEKQCLGDGGKCLEPVVARERCASHYRRHLRGGSDDAPVLAHRGELVSLSLRVTKEAERELAKAGGGYRVGAKVLEDWAAKRAKKGS